ncbi:uncharacterized protein [Hoplias malabaricus]|uniref:uncharacterized protein n=1 Tax=Hoplias malabaricus TaxID=27720 RepID=UPI003462F540
MAFFRPTVLQPVVQVHRFIEGPAVFFSHGLPYASAGVQFINIQPVFHRYGLENHLYPGFLRPIGPAVSPRYFVAPANVQFNTATSAGLCYPLCAAGQLPLAQPSAVNICQQQLFGQCLQEQHCSLHFTVETGRKRIRELSDEEDLEPPHRRPRLSSTEDTCDAVVDKEEDLLFPDLIEELNEEPGIWELAEEMINLLDEVPGIWDEGFSVAV